MFISYRVASDRDLAVRLHKALSSVVLEETGDELRVYLDSACLVDGERWDVGFMKGLISSFIFVPIVSAAGLAPMIEGSDPSGPDNVLMEWIGALELHSRKKIRAVIPVLVGGKRGDFFTDAEAAFGGLQSLGQHAPRQTLDGAMLHLEAKWASAS